MSVRPAAAVRADSWRAARTLVTAGRSFDVDVQDRDTGLALEPGQLHRNGGGTGIERLSDIGDRSTVSQLGRARAHRPAALLAGVLASTTVFAVCGRWPRTSRGQASAGWGSPKSAAASSPS